MLWSRLRRPKLAVPLALIAVLAGVAIIFVNRQRGPATPADYLSYFPEREATIFYLDVGAIRSSGILEKLVGSTMGGAAAGEASDYQTFIQQTGFDYKRDLNRVMLNSAGGIHYFVLEGRFDWPKLRAYAEREGGRCSGVNYCHVRGSTPDRIISWRRISDNYMALASARDEAGARAVDRRSADNAGPAPFDLPPTPLWIHIPGNVMRANQQLPTGTRLFAKALENSERAVFALGPEAGKFALTADIISRTPEDAAILKAQLEGLTKMLTSLIARESKLPASGDLSGVLTSGVFARTERHVKARWTVQKAFLDSLGGS